MTPEQRAEVWGSLAMALEMAACAVNELAHAARAFGGVIPQAEPEAEVPPVSPFLRRTVPPEVTP